MANETLISLLKEYDQKKIQAELDLEKRKEYLYKKIPRLQEIENELNHLSIETSKNILKNSSYSTNLFNEKINNLKHEKQLILQ